jgi:predicted N-acetyltransferase YhbS
MSATSTTFTLRALTAEEVPEAARICSLAFNTLHIRLYGRETEFADPNFALSAISGPIAAGSNQAFVVGVYNESGKLIGSNVIDISSEAAGIGPISVDPSVQSIGAGRKLMEAVISRAKEVGKKSIRLLQEAPNTVSYSLYAKMGFIPQDQLAVFDGVAAKPMIPIEECSKSFTIRQMTSDDFAAAAAIHKRVVGTDRLPEISTRLSEFSKKVFGIPLVAYSVMRPGTLVGFISSSNFFGFLVSESEEIASALYYEFSNTNKHFSVHVLKVMGRLNPILLRWALGEGGLKLVRQMTLMSLGDYRPPEGGVYCPGGLY